uniref:Interferon alpha-inducible protein 27-like protein 2A n=1 Tax=Oncorhynchus kisutch TaxID=8019 RepID=A0A8C7H530_ONCKI
AMLFFFFMLVFYPITSIWFTAAGIAAKSVAAGMMASAATASGGGVLAGSTVAVLQSAGAAGLAGSTTAVVAGVGGAVGWLTATAAGLI